MSDTPTRILEAAWALVIERGTVDETVAEIAAAAGVSRQLVYFHFDNRAGLLTAMARQRDESSGFVEAALAGGDDGGSAWRERMGELREALRIASTVSRAGALWRPAGRSSRPPTGRGRGSSRRPGSTWSPSAAGRPASTPSAPWARCSPSS